MGLLGRIRVYFRGRYCAWAEQRRGSMLRKPAGASLTPLATAGERQVGPASADRVHHVTRPLLVAESVQVNIVVSGHVITEPVFMNLTAFSENVFRTS